MRLDESEGTNEPTKPTFSKAEFTATEAWPTGQAKAAALARRGGEDGL
jgi:hypothetical protein